MIDEAAIERAWQGPWQRMPRALRRFLVSLAAGLGIMYSLWFPFLLIGGYRDTGLAFLGLAVVGVGTAVVLHRRWAPEHRAYDALKAQGVRVTGHLLRSRATPAPPGDSSVTRYYLFGAEVPGGPPVFAHLTARMGLEVGVEATIAYDPVRPNEGVVVESVSELRRRARRE